MRPAFADEGRLAIVAGNNFGLPEEIPLRFAERDATQVAETLSEIGGVSRPDLWLLLDEGPAAIRAAFLQAQQRRPRILTFYYSGHAGSDGLHLAGGTVRFDELRGLLEASGADVKIVLIDACQAGAMISDKGLTVTLSSTRAAAPSAVGTAILASAEPGEVAQEDANLGGSYFTHFLLSGLRGAADADGDLRVTLAEAHAYSSRHTEGYTTSWARRPQRPVYSFDVSGREEVVLADLRRGAGLLRVSEDIAGHLAVIEVGSDWVQIELDKQAGRPAVLSLDRGRYAVHVREPDGVYAASVDVPWGGEVEIRSADLVAYSYQSIAQKGALLEIRRHRLSIQGSVMTELAPGMGPLPFLQGSYGLQLGPIELGLRVGFSKSGLSAVDGPVGTTIAAAAAAIGRSQPVGVFDLRLWLGFEAQRWAQEIRGARPRTSGVFGASLGAAWRLPLFERTYLEPTLEAGIFGVPTTAGAELRPTLSFGLGVGVLL